MLNFGGDRGLCLNGQVHDLPLGDPTNLTDSNRARWEAAAERGGHQLDALLAEDM
ncbi:hypothetical protein ACFWXB_16200 [Tsukamurella tyrosinosolvens]|uniref:hypothetical protein n=1 Tax=Tsukamurella tyrosinosolvens TaxID=57704 RepID=UPI0036C95F8B